MKHTITVLQDDIDNGTTKASSDCPIARAARRDLNIDRVALTADCLWIGPVEAAHLPDAAITFVRNFDKGSLVEPFKFEIDIP